MRALETDSWAGILALPPTNYRSWASFSNSLCFSYLICKMRVMVIIAYTSQFIVLNESVHVKCILRTRRVNNIITIILLARVSFPMVPLARSSEKTGHTL